LQPEFGNMIRIALFGAGRMAASFAELVHDLDDVEICAVVSLNAPDWLADPATDIAYFDDIEQLQQLDTLPDLVLDFSLPEGTAAAATWCGQHRVALLSGVTGLESQHRQTLDIAALTAPVMWSPNLSLGINLLASLAKQAVAALPANTHIHIHDVHHHHKKDAPSGTALMLGEKIAEARSGEMPHYSSVREGEVIGQHEITLEWLGESITLTHHAFDRGVFARGALSATRWLVKQPKGRYSADDWLAGL